MKKRSMLLVFVILIVLIIVLNINMVLAVSGVSLKITGTIGDYTSDVWLRTDSDSESGNTFDAYDMVAPSSPSDYSKFSSTIPGYSLAVDSWSPAARDVDLVYDMPDEQSGDVVFSWSDIVSSVDYTASFSITGDAGSNLNMISDTDNSYTYTASNDSDIYITISIAVPEEEETTTPSAAGSSAAVVSQPPIDLLFELNPNTLLFDASIAITDEFKVIYEGEKMRSTINLIPMGIDPDLDVYLTYYILDEYGNEVRVGAGEHETTKITGQTSIDKTFYTDMLEPGTYDLYIELEYDSDPDPDSKKMEIATAYSEFVVLEGVREEAEVGLNILATLSNYRIIILVGGLTVLVLLILVILVLRKPKIKKLK